MADVSSALAEYREFLAQLRDRAAIRVAEETRDAAPRGKTGALQDSMDPGQALSYEDAGYVFSATIRTDVEYAAYTDLGTQPHVIEGNPLLRFEWDNGPQGPGVYFFRHVNHPGTPAMNWFTEPMEGRWAEALEAEVS